MRPIKVTRYPLRYVVPALVAMISALRDDPDYGLYFDSQRWELDYPRKAKPLPAPVVALVENLRPYAPLLSGAHGRAIDQAIRALPSMEPPADLFVLWEDLGLFSFRRDPRVRCKRRQRQNRSPSSTCYVC